MGFVSRANDEAAIKKINEVIEAIKPHDGKVHILYFNLNSKYVNGPMYFEAGNTEFVDTILGELQDHGRQVIDVKFTYIVDTPVGIRSVQILYK